MAGRPGQQGDQVFDRDFVDALGGGRQIGPERLIEPAVGQPIELGADVIPRHGRGPEAIKDALLALDHLPALHLDGKGGGRRCAGDPRLHPAASLDKGAGINLPPIRCNNNGDNSSSALECSR
jgi:hypothetical protein